MLKVLGRVLCDHRRSLAQCISNNVAIWYYLGREIRKRHHMKNHLLIICITYFFILPSLSSQEDHIHLWEISGNNLHSKSYLFGSIHLNDTRLFQFSDSLALALQSCEAFATEIHMDSLNTFISKAFESESFDNDPEETTESQSGSDYLRYLDKNGKETLLDVYLAAIAKQLDKKIYGLEKVEDQENLFTYSDAESFSQSHLDSMIDFYSTGDVNLLHNFISRSYPNLNEDLDMIARNKTQLFSFLSLAKKHSTFAVVGVGHLRGESNVLEMLEGEGYKIRQVKAGQIDNRMEEWYERYKTDEWVHITSQNQEFTIEAPYPEVMNLETDGVEMIMNMDFYKGLVYMTLRVPNIDNIHESIAEMILEEWSGKDSLSLTLIKTHDDSTSRKEHYYFENPSLTGQLQVTTSSNIVCLQLVLGFSKSSLEDEDLRRYFESIQILGSDPTWKILEVPSAHFKVMFPGTNKWQSNKLPNPDFPARGDVEIHYNIGRDPETLNQYLVRYQNMSPGTLYLDEKEDLLSTLNYFAQQFSKEVTVKTYSKLGGYHSLSGSMSDSLNQHLHFKGVIRGNQMIILLEFSSNPSANLTFFNSLTLLPAKPAALSSYIYDNADFKIDAPTLSYSYDSYAEDSTLIQNISFSDNSTNSTIDFDFRRLSNYESLDTLAPSILSDSIELLESFDTVLSVDRFHYQDSLWGYAITYRDDSSSYFFRSFTLFFNNHKANLLFAVPIELLGSDYVDNIIQSMQIKVQPTALALMMENKGRKILEDLRSTDSIIFNLAATALSEHTFDSIYQEELVDLLLVPKIDSLEPFNSDFYLVTSLHEFGSTNIEEAFLNLYNTTSNQTTKTRILESLSLRSSPQTIPTLLDVLTESEPSTELPSEIYSSFRDSLELFDRNFNRLKSLSAKGPTAEPFIETALYWHKQDSQATYIDSNRLFFDSLIDAKIRLYELNLSTDSSLSIATYVMDYLLNFPSSSLEERIRSVVLQIPDTYSKYQLLYNDIKLGRALDTSLIVETMESEYYAYYIVDALEDNNRFDEIPERFKDTAYIASLVMKNHFYESYDIWCDSCKVIETVVDLEMWKEDRMLLTQCWDEQEGYFLGLIGPFNSDGRFNMSSDISTYYNERQFNDNPVDLVPAMIEYMRTSDD